MSDETVRVPAALVEALRGALGKSFAEMDPGTLRRMYGDVGSAAYALVDAAERPDEGEHRCKTCGLPDGPDYGDPHECPPGFLTAPTPVGEPLKLDEPLYDYAKHGDDLPARPDARQGEPLCECGHTRNRHTEFMPKNYCIGSPTMGTACPCTAFTPAPLSSPRRTRDEGTEDEAEAAWQAFDEDNILDADGFAHAAFVAGYRQGRADA